MIQTVAAPWLLAGLLATGFTCGWLWHRARLPGGALLGSLLPVGAMYLLVPGLPTPPAAFRLCAQILVGMVIGASITKDSLRAVAKVFWPALATVALMLSASVVVGLGIALVLDLPMDAAILATIPGGAGDMTAVALDLNADAGLVAAFHVVRQLVLIVLVSGLIRRRFGVGGISDRGA